MVSPPGWCAVLGLSLAACLADLVTWPGCPCSSPGNCSRILARGTPDNQAQILNLKNCNITAIQSGDFLLPNAQWVNLKNNNIERVDADDFKHLTGVKYLNLEYNSIRGERIHPEAFHKCRRLEGIGFCGNNMMGAPIDLLEGLCSLKLLFFSHASLVKVPILVTRVLNLEHLDLSNNKITLDDSDTFSALKHMKNLILSHNRIEIMPEAIFSTLSNLHKLHLHHNLIKCISEKLFTNLGNLKSLQLQNNFIEHVPQSLIQNCARLEEINISGNRLTHLPENFLPNSNPLKRFYFSANPWQCACLIKLLGQIKKRKITYNSNEYNGHNVTCVTKDFICHRNSEYLKLYDEIETSLHPAV